MSEELKPCPFCRSKARYGIASISCTNDECGAVFHAGFCQEKEVHINVWNTRYQKHDLGEMLSTYLQENEFVEIYVTQQVGNLRDGSNRVKKAYENAYQAYRKIMNLSFVTQTEQSKEFVYQNDADLIDKAPAEGVGIEENVSECIGEIFGSAWNFDLPEDHPQNQNLNDYVEFIRNHISQQAAEIVEKDKRIAELESFVQNRAKTCGAITAGIVDKDCKIIMKNKRIVLLQEALLFYADSDNYKPRSKDASMIMRDKGRIARKYVQKPIVEGLIDDT